ncbi:formate dehydrogenase accessory sulfurtransferase FdhD [Arenimonas sp.]|uniref:formate dehydrogenase accessory sulfurtransferase FdhD n=1 Tax=Arenimonas sp. TaxID=1872635 RepID=UPI0039E70541
MTTPDRASAVSSRSALRIDGGQRHRFNDVVIEERPVALSYNGVAHAVMMATPADLEDFALGFSLSEGIVDSPAQWRFVEAMRTDAGLVLEMLVPQANFDRLAERRRAMVAQSGCGLCGSESLQAAMRPAPRVDARRAVSVDEILRAVDALAAHQDLNRQSGGVHAAGFAHAEGLLVREDVGRHNALDKLVGARARQSLGEGFLVLSSRASHELLHKAATAGIAVVATISAPSTLAIETAQRCGITLACFVRGSQMTVYSHPERLA